ncbi:MAG: SLC13 family permease [Acidimicrobiales bacterium]
MGLALAALWALVPLLVDFDGLSPQGHRMLAVFGVAVVLWVTEAIPLHATAVGIIFAEILLVSDQALFDLPASYEPPPFADFYAALAHPVLMLFLGGFVLAQAAATYGLDRNLAGVLLRPFGQSPAALLAGLMGITALLSMFMSNTATTAAMMAVVLPVAATLAPGDPLRSALALSVPVAANIGGIGTPVGTPPNAIAIGLLANAGIDVDFVQWMAIAVPLAAVLLGVAWVVLLRRYPAAADQVELTVGGAFDRSRPAVILYVTFAATVGLWLTEPLHGIDTSITGFLPVVVLLATGVFGTDDLRSISWDVLWLVAGGLALGSGVTATGLDAWVIDLVDWSALSSLALLAGMAGVAIVLSTVISNSATANLLLPIGVSLAASSAVTAEPLLVGVVVAIACSLAMALPVSTPPNAVAYATGMVTTGQMAGVGLVVGGVGIVLLVVAAPPLWDLLGLVP